MSHQRHILDPMGYGSDIFSPRCGDESIRSTGLRHQAISSDF